jgi:hypothetical protein
MNTKAVKVTKNDHFVSPKSIPESQLDELFEGYGITGLKKSAAADSLNDLISAHQKYISEQPRQSREAFRKSLERAANYLRSASGIIANSGVLGAEFLKKTLPSDVAPMFSVDWLNEAFPNNDQLPDRTFEKNRIGKSRIKSRLTVEDNFERIAEEAKYYFFRSNGQQLVARVLRDMGASLEEAIASSKLPQGKTPTSRRHNFLVGLIYLWEKKLGRDPRATKGQTFKDFCEVIFEYVGWPQVGLSKAIEKVKKNPSYLET